MAFTHTNRKGEKYYLHKKDVTLRGSGKRQTIYFFAREQRSGVMDNLPAGFQVLEVKKTGLPVLKKK
ncbi:MAG: hypothetical protein HY429_03525 [Candidatus Levybacteria bacterium]|nr:hypothetical protein [Candidatus Levybacteria bacterium]